MRKIVFFDIDGTLLNKENKLPESAKKAIKALQANGIYVAIATGRAPFMFKELRKELGIESFVSFNGQYVVFEGEIIKRNPLSKKLLSNLVQFSTKKGHPLVFQSEKTMKANVKDDPFIKISLESLNFTHPEIDENFYQHHDIYQSLIFCEQADEQMYIERYPAFTFIRWHKYSMDVIPKGGSKAEGIQTMIKELQVEMENVYAFGDSLNDIEMLQAVGTGVAMGNGLDIVKENADFVTGDVEEDGIYNGLKKLHLI